MASFNAYTHPPLLPEGPGLAEQRERIELPYGRIDLQRYCFEGITVEHATTHFNGRHSFHKDNEGGAVYLSFNLRGRYTIEQAGRTFEVLPGQHNVVRSKSFDNTFSNHALIGETFSIGMSAERFAAFARDGNETVRRFIDALGQDQPVVMAPASPPISMDLEQAIRALLACPFQGGMKQLYLLSKSIEILVLQAESFDRAAQNPLCKLDVRGKAQMEAARDYLDAHIADPPSLSQLARAIGTNEYSLKRGFKERFGTTVFGYLSAQRLARARIALRGSTDSIAEIAHSLGYSSSQHFSRAFKEGHGTSPGRYRRG